MPRPSDAPGTCRTAGGQDPARGPRRRLARDLFLVGLRETLGRRSGDGSREAAPPLATLLGRALAGIPARETRETAAATGISHGR